MRPVAYVYGAGIGAALLSSLGFYVAFSEGIFSPDFFITLLWACITGTLAFLCFSPWRQINFLIGGVLLTGAAVWMFAQFAEEQNQDFAATLFWAVAFLLLGLYCFIRSHDTTLNEQWKSLLDRKVIQTTAKIVLWAALILVGLLMLAGVFSFLAGLSPMTIIIVLLVLIWLK